MEPAGIRILVTGADGFLGNSLYTRLKECSADEIVPVSRTGTDQVNACDLCNQDDVNALLSAVRPSKIFHCAGSFTNDFKQDFRSNSLTTFHILEAIEKLNIACRTLLIGSAAEYGLPETERGYISEDQSLDPVSSYGLSKVFQTQLMQLFFRRSGTDVVMARIFNLDGEGVSPLLFPGQIRAQIKEYLSKEIDTIRVGDLSAYRDYLPVENAVSDLILLMEHGCAGEIYNIGSGTPVQMKKYLRCLLEKHNIGMDAVISDDTIKTRSSSVSIVAADLTKIRKLKDAVN